MPNSNLSKKREQVVKTNTAMVAIVAVAAFLVIFTLVASRALWVKMSFQNRVIAEKEVARDQLRTNIESTEDLVIAYKAFTERPNNVIGGSSSGKGEKDGDNAQLVLDALPSKYDFPGLATSLEKILKSNGNTINSISGSDDEINQSTKEGDSSNPIEILFELSANGNSDSINKLLSIFERSIRPISIQKIDFSGTNADLQLSVTAKTYYQPGKTLDVKTKVVQ